MKCRFSIYVIMHLSLILRQNSALLMNTQWTESWHTNIFLCHSWIQLFLFMSLSFKDQTIFPAPVLSNVQFRPSVFVDILFLIQWNRVCEHVKSKQKKSGLGTELTTQIVIKDYRSSLPVDKMTHEDKSQGRCLEIINTFLNKSEIWIEFYI